MEPGGDVPLPWHCQKEMGAGSLHTTGCSHGTGAGGDPAVPTSSLSWTQTLDCLSLGSPLSLEVFMLYRPSQGHRSAVTVVGPESLLNFL